MTKAEFEFTSLVHRFKQEMDNHKKFRPSTRHLTPAEHLRIEQLCRQMSSGDIAKAIKRSEFAVEHYMRKHRLFAPKRLRAKWMREKMMKRSTSTPDEDLVLQMWYLTLPEKAVAYHLRRSHTFVRTRMRQLGLVKPRWLIKEHKSCYQKGAIPVNKGKKQHEFMSAEAIERTKATRFQKGQMPHNSFEERSGIITVRDDHMKRGGRQRMWIKLDHGKWQELTRYVWEKTHKRKVPDGYVIWQKDQDWMNVDPENLECITRGEDARRNGVNIDYKKLAQWNKKRWKDLQGISDKHVVSFMTRDKELRKILLQSPELIELKRLQLQLRQQIKKKIK